jgi:hypothetical protein
MENPTIRLFLRIGCRVKRRDEARSGYGSGGDDLGA